MTHEVRARDGAWLRVRMLGRFTVSTPGGDAGEDGWRIRKAKSLVKLLSLAPGHRLEREVLIDQLWPDLEPKSAANNLRVALHAARSVLGEEELLSRGSVVVLGRGDSVWVDVEAFERAAEATRTVGLPACAAALALYGGDLLPEDRYEDWSVPRRERLRDLFHALLETSAALHDRSGDVGSARAARERLVASDPTHEAARAWLMRSYATSGDRPRALRHYEQLVAALRSELDAEPDAETSDLHHEIASGRPRSPGANAVLMRQPDPVRR